jgi:hypothetical protein
VKCLEHIPIRPLGFTKGYSLKGYRAFPIKIKRAKGKIDLLVMLR